MPAEAERVVFDCVVFTQAIINPDGSAGRCLELAREGAISLCISDYVMMEIRELPEKLAPRISMTPAIIADFIADLARYCQHIATVPNVYILERDPDDSHYINLAVAAGAKLISSRDRDLLDLMNDELAHGLAFQRQFPGLRILTPQQLLDHVRKSA